MAGAVEKSRRTEQEQSLASPAAVLGAVEPIELSSADPALVMVGDAVEQMRRLPDRSVDAVLCDPPYGTTQCQWDAVIPLSEMWEQLHRVCRPGAPMAFTACMPFSAALLMSNPKRFRHHWVWEKNKATGHLNAKRAPMRAHEDVLVFCDRPPAYVPQMTNGHAPMNGYTQTSNGACYGSTKRPSGGGTTLRYPRTVQRFGIVNNDDPAKTHPTQKPVELLTYLLRTYTQPGDVVLDFACGSGSTGEACQIEGRRFIGIEKDALYAQIARNRLNGSEVGGRPRHLREGGR